MTVSFVLVGSTSRQFETPTKAEDQSRIRRLADRVESQRLLNRIFFSSFFNQQDHVFYMERVREHVNGTDAEHLVTL